MINHKNLVYIALCVGVLAYAMEGDSLFNIREEMRNLHAGTRNQDVSLAGNAAISLLQRAATLKVLTLQNIEGESAPIGQVPSPFMRSFFYDLIIIGQAQLLDIFLDMLHRSYGNVGINWLYTDSEGNSYTMLDKAYRLKQDLIAAGYSTVNINHVLSVLIKHGGLYGNIPAAGSASTQQGLIHTPPEPFQ